MGCLGERHAREHYDWSVVLNRYSDLLDDLLERRQKALTDPVRAPSESLQAIPELTQIFAAWPSRTIDSHTAIKPCGDSPNLHNYLQLAMVRIYRNELPPPQLIRKTFQQLQALGNPNLKQLQSLAQPSWSDEEASRLPEALGWLLKHGFAEVNPA